MGLKKEIVKVNEDGEIMCTYNSLSELCNELNIDKYAASRLVRKEKFINGMCYRYSGEVTNKKHSDYSVTCPYCGKNFKTYNGLAKHIFRYNAHGEITQEQLLVDYKYNGIRPLCKCGCGCETEISYTDGEAHFNDYINGHNGRGVPKDFSEEHRKYLSERLKNLHITGGIKYWMKGKHKEDLTPEQIEAFRTKVWENPERNKNLSKALTGKPQSQEHLDKLIEIRHTERYKSLMQQKMYERITERGDEFIMRSQLEIDFIDNFIKPLGVEYITQYYLPDIKQYCDVYIPSKNLVIECDGDFWHVNPAKYPDGPIFDYQVSKVERDKIKNKYLIENGYGLLRIWETDIKKDPEKVHDLINENVL